MDESLVLRAFEPGDEEHVRELQSRVFGAVDPEHWRRKFDWQYRQNPAAGSSSPLAWVLEHAGRRVGFFGRTPWRVAVQGEVRPAVAGADWCVDPSLRQHAMGPALARRFLDAEPGCFPFATSPKAEVLPWWRYLGAQTLTGDAVAGLWVTTAANLEPRRPAPNGRDVEVLFEFGSEVDEFFARIAPRLGWIGVRDSAYLRWRYFEYPFARSHVGALRRGGRLEGLVVVQSDRSLGRMIVAELLCAAEDEATPDALLGHAKEVFRESGLGELYLLHRRPEVTRAAARARFHEVLGHPLAFLCAKPPAGPPLGEWYLTGGDGDLLFSARDD